MSKSLSILQTIAKVARIVCKVIFILCIIGGIGCLAGLLVLLILSTATFGEGGLLSELTGGDTFLTASFGCVMGAIACAGEAILARYGERYFSHELEAGTPFTQDGAKELFRLGITTLIVSVATSVISAIVYGIFLLFTFDLVETDFSMTTSLGTGLVCLLLSVIFGHGAELRAQLFEARAEAQAAEEAQETEQTAEQTTESL